MPQFDRFTDRARRVLVHAQEEAWLLDQGCIGTEHLLLGLLKEEEGVAARTLVSLGVSLDAAREKVEEIVGTAERAPSGSPPFSPRAKKVLELSLREALELGHDTVGTEHVLLGLLREEEGAASRVLVSLGVDLGRVRHEVLGMLTNRSGTDTADAVPPIRPRASSGHHVHRLAPPPIRRRLLAVPPLLVLVSAGLVGLGAGWVASRRALQRVTWRVADAEARLDQLVDAGRVGGRHRPRARRPRRQRAGFEGLHRVR